jgi:BirA family biotin operon repressor/biotin-[acetyl-CoA-carboxylase] ligase
MKTATKKGSVFELDRIERETLVRQVIFRRTVRSTNDRALQLASRSDLPLPLLVLAERQTGGRGRGTNRWWSASGSLTFSLLLDAAPRLIRPEQWPQVSLAAATAVCDAIDDVWPGRDCGIRWPNDVYVAGRKVCGILPEPVAAPDSGSVRLVVGIGINVNNGFVAAPSDVRARAASLADLSGRRYDLTEVLVRVLTRLDVRLRQLACRDARLSDTWTARCVLRARTVELVVGPRRVRGLCHGVDRAGALRVAIGGRIERFLGGVVAAVE